MRDRLQKLFADRANQNVGLLAEYEHPGALYDAVKALRKEGYTRLDTYSPFPIHGMDAAMGLGPSKLGFLVFIGGATGAFLGFLMQWWMSEVDYAINVSNKPLYGFEASVPIIFELTILFSALAAIGGMLALNALPKPYNPLFFSERFSRATDDGFFLHIQEADGRFDSAQTAAHLVAAGALAVEHITHDGAVEVDASGQPVATSLPVVTEPADAPAPAEPTDAPVAPAHTTGQI